MVKKSPQLFIVSGLILLLLAGGLTVYSLVDDYLAGQRAQLVLKQMQEAPPTLPIGEVDSGAILDYLESDEYAEDAMSGSESDISDPTESNYVNQEAPDISQYDTIGVLSISCLELELPILSECASDLLKVSVCRYMGEAQDKPGRLIVAGHNYKSHFGKLTKLAQGDEVRFTTPEGISYCYTVSEITEISMYDHEALEQGEWDITLFTCNSDGSRRILVRCQEVQS